MPYRILKNISRALLLLVCFIQAATAGAQLHEHVSVEGKYVPDIIRVDRINVLPKAMRLSLASTPIGYESEGVATSFNPSLLAMPATSWRASREIADNPGYIELGAGSWLNSTLSAGYRFIDNSSTLFGVRLQHNSTSLWKPDLSPTTRDITQKRYDESIALYASHVFKGLGRLDAALDYHIGYFNYYGYVPAYYWGNESAVAPTQTLNDVAMRLDWRSLITPASSLSYNASLRVRHFAYRNLALPYDAVPDHEKGARESEIALSGGLRMPWDNGNSIALDADLDMVFTASNRPAVYMAEGNPYPIPAANLPGVDDYALLTLTPSYRFNKGLLDIRIGADIDLSFKAGPEGNRYPFFHIAPDVRFALQTGQVGLFLNVLGGSELNTLSRLYQLDYYGMPRVMSTRPSYTPLDAAFGVNLGPFSGFSLGVEARYRATKNTPLGGWYMAWLGNASLPPAGIIPEAPVGSDFGYSTDAKGLDMHGVSLSGKISYQYGDLFSITAEGSIQPQDGEKGYFNGYDRPKATCAVKVSGSPMKRLLIGAGFHYRGKRAIYMRSELPHSASFPVIDGERTTLHHLPLPDLYLVNISASYDLFHNFSLWIQGDNLLNRHSETLPMQPMQGVVVAGGFKWLF